MAVIEERQNKTGSSWRVTWYRDGKRQPPLTVKSREKAEEWKRLLELHKGDHDAAGRDLARVKHAGPTLDEVYEHWMERHRGSPYTRQGYASHWKHHIGPALGRFPVSSVTADDIRSVIATLEGKERAPKTIRNIVGTLGQVLSHAERRHWIESNPWDDDLLPKNRRVKAERDKFLTLDEAELIIGGITNQLPYRVMLATGMRPQELCALTVGDAHLDAQQPSIRVTQAVRQDREKGDYIGDTKSQSSVRTIGLPPSAAEALRPAVERRAPGDPLLTQADGPGKNARQVPIKRKRLYQTWQRRIEKLRRDGKLTKKPDLYSLRHTHASLMLDAGMQIWQLSRHLGHASVTITDQNYAHLMPDAHYQAASFAAKALSPTSPAALPASQS